MPVLRWMVACVLLCQLLWVGPVGRSQESSTQLTPRQRANWDFEYDLFQLLLEEQGLRVVEGVEAVSDPTRSILVYAGDVRSVQLIDFVERGGNALVVSDSAFMIPRVGSGRSGPVSVRDATYRYQGFTDCLQLAPNPSSEVLGKVRSLVLNRTGWFRPDSTRLRWESLIALPAEGCQPFSSNGQPVLAVGNADSGGRIIVASDGSLLTNGMVWHGDNAVVAVRIANLLSGRMSYGAGEALRKTKFAFYSQGREQTSVRNTLMPPPDLPSDATPAGQPQPPEATLERALRLGNAVAQEVQTSNVLNEALSRQPRRLWAGRYFWFLLFMAASAFLVGTLWFLSRSGVFRNSFPIPAKMLAAFELRDSEAGPDGDYRGPVGYLAREFCYELTGSKQSEEWRQFWGNFQKVAKSNWRPQDFEFLRELLDIASRGCHNKIDVYGFQRYGVRIDELRRLYLKS